MRTARILLAAVLVGGLSNFVESHQASADYKLDYPKEAFGFSGTLLAEVAKAPDPTYGWFEVKIIKVLKLDHKNKTKQKRIDTLTNLWKDKYVAVLGVKGMEDLKVGDLVLVEATNHEVHLRATKVAKDKANETNPSKH